LIMGLIIQH